MLHLISFSPSPFDKWRLLLLFLMFSTITSLYSPYYKRCRVNKQTHVADQNAVAIQQLQIQQIPNSYYKYVITPVIRPELQINYEQFNYYYHSFIDAGGSGQVYLVQDNTTGQGKVAKRYYKQRPQQFRRENYIMSVLNYPILWTKSCKGTNQCLEDSQFNTVSIFPYRETIALKSLEFDAEQAPLIFYKLLKEMDKCHKAGIVHNDIKMGNVLINSLGPNFKFYELQLIDWNLARFYYTGYEQNSKRGTPCYYAPQSLLRTIFTNPTRDIWSLGVAMFTYYTNEKPFTFPCKKDNLRAIVSLTGAQKIIQLIKKYRMNCMDSIPLLNDLQANKHKYPQLNLYQFKPKQNKQFYTKELVDVFKRMMQPDPQKRATAEQLMKMKYFRHLTSLPDMYYYRDKRRKENKQKIEVSFNETVNK